MSQAIADFRKSYDIVSKMNKKKKKCFMTSYHGKYQRMRKLKIIILLAVDGALLI